jgi:hypothetical protein
MTRVTNVSFEQATIKIEKEGTFAELRASIERALAADRAEKFLKRLESRGLRIRDLESVLQKQVLESVDLELKKSGKVAKALYQELPVSDQAQMREFYLSKLETVEIALRHKFKKLFQYY